jgi:hypothetical protein
MKLFPNRMINIRKFIWVIMYPNVRTYDNLI